MFFLYYSGIPVLLTIMGKANWFYSQKIVGKITVFDWLREVWFCSIIRNFQKKLKVQEMRTVLYLFQII